MKKVIFVLVVCLFAGCGEGGYEVSDKSGRAYDKEGLTVFDLRGSWYQMGRQYGLLAKEQLTDVLGYLDRMIGTDADKVAEAAETADRLYANYPRHLKEFFKGVTQTSGLDLERVKLCNAVEYVEGVFLCSAMAAWDGYGAGKLTFGRNYDAASYEEIGRDVVVTVFHPDKGVAAAIVGYAGELYCVNGFNAKGLFVELNNGMPSAGTEIYWDLCPSTTSLFEILFSAQSLGDVDDFFQKTRSSLAVTIGVADKKEARSYEWCPDGVRRGDVMTDDGLMVSTNHYVNEEWPYPVPSDEGSWNSLTRRRHLLAQAEQHKGSIDTERMMEIMSTPLEEGGPRHDLTRYQIVAVPEDMTLFIHVPCIGKWVEMDMGEVLD